MNSNEARQLMAQYPVRVVNRATRNLGEDAAFFDIEAECKRLYRILGGRTFFQELERRMTGTHPATLAAEDVYESNKPSS